MLHWTVWVDNSCLFDKHGIKPCSYFLRMQRKCWPQRMFCTSCTQFNCCKLFLQILDLNICIATKVMQNKLSDKSSSFTACIWLRHHMFKAPYIHCSKIDINDNMKHGRKCPYQHSTKPKAKFLKVLTFKQNCLKCWQVC